jgi:hypothetical protein
MIFTTKKARLSLYITLALCSGMYVTKAMEQEEPALKRRKTEEQSTSAIEKKPEGHVSPLETLPSDLKFYIISFLVNADRVEEALKSIKYLSITSKCFYSLINDPQVLGSLMKGISKRFSGQLADKLFQAVRTQDKKLTVFCLNAGADANAQQGAGYIPLHSAATLGNKEIVELLIQHGANVNKADDMSYITPLFNAVLLYRTDVIKLLLKAGADINVRNSNGKTPLDFAADCDRYGQSYENIVGLLLEFKADK